MDTPLHELSDEALAWVGMWRANSVTLVRHEQRRRQHERARCKEVLMEWIVENFHPDIRPDGTAADIYMAYVNSTNTDHRNTTTYPFDSFQKVFQGFWPGLWTWAMDSDST
jgi:hypothetical protein